MNGPHGQTPPHAAWMDSWMALMIQWSVCHMLYGSMTHYSPGQIFGLPNGPLLTKPNGQVARCSPSQVARGTGGRMLTWSEGQIARCPLVRWPHHHMASLSGYPIVKWWPPSQVARWYQGHETK